MKGRRLNKALRLTFIKKYGIIYIENWKGEYMVNNTMQSLDITPDTRRMNVELSNKSMDEVKENLNAAWKEAVNHPSHYCEGR